MAQSQIFDYEVNNFNDVRDHLDALWSEFNQLFAAFSVIPPVCGDPPNTCGIAPEPAIEFASALESKRRLARKGTKAKPPAPKAKG